MVEITKYLINLPFLFLSLLVFKNDYLMKSEMINIIIDVVYIWREHFQILKIKLDNYNCIREEGSKNSDIRLSWG